MRTPMIVANLLAIAALGAGCAGAPRAQSASATPRCAVAAVVTQPEQVIRDPRAHPGEAFVVAGGAQAARGQEPAPARAPRLVAYQDPTVTRSNTPPSSCTPAVRSAQWRGSPRS